MRRSDLHGALLSAGLLVSACGPPAPPPEGPCANDPRVDLLDGSPVKIGAGGLRVRLVEAMPSPPVKGDNSWTVQVLGPAGAPVDGASLAITPYMPDHQHGTSIKAQTVPMGDGKYRLSPLNLFMAAFWEVRLAVSSGAGSDMVVFGVCIEG